MIDAKTRFSDRVDDYVKFRPHYPRQIIKYLEQQIGFSRKSVVADIGSGTGISSELFLHNGNKVLCVEPNANMRHAAEERLSKFPIFTSLDGTAESTTLPDQSVDVIVAGQAFHWFDRKNTRREFERVGRKHSHVVLMWNDREDSTPFMLAYEEFVKKFSIDYERVNHKNVDDAAIQDFFSPVEVHRKEFFHSKTLSRDALKGLVCSSSYMPNRDHAGFAPMIDAVEALYEEFEQGGAVTIEYACRLHYGKLTGL